MIEQKERERQLSERLIRQMQLEEDTHPSEESVAEDEVRCNCKIFFSEDSPCRLVYC